MMKKLRAAVAIVMTFAVLAFAASPATAALSKEKGSISVDLSELKNTDPAQSLSFRLYFVAKAEISNGGINYKWTPPYEEANIDLSDLQDSSLPLHLAYFAQTESLTYTEKSADEKGELVFENLSHGLYLLVPSQGDSHTVAPFVISVPTYDAENKAWIYDVDASPKIDGGIEGGEDKDTYISVVKKWDTDASHPGSVTVVLLCDFEEYERVQLSESNNWHHRWDNLPQEHIWSVVEAQVPDGYTVRYETSSNTVTVINSSDVTEETTKQPSESETQEDKLVQTGQLNWPVPICAIAGLLLFSVGWAVLNFGRKESE